MSVPRAASSRIQNAPKMQGPRVKLPEENSKSRSKKRTTSHQSNHTSDKKKYSNSEEVVDAKKVSGCIQN